MTGWSTHLPVLQVVIPLLTAPLAALTRERTLAWTAATAASLLAFAMAVQLTITVGATGAQSYPVGSWPAPYGIEIAVDSFSTLLLLVITGASSAALLVAHRTFRDEVPRERQHLFYAAWLVTLAGLCGMVVAGDAFNIFVFMEISSLGTYILVSGGARREALPAAFKYLVMGTIGATFYLVGVGLLYMVTGTLNIADMHVRLGEVPDPTPVFAAAAFITTGLALKAAVFPLHAWLPNAYTFAPNAVSAFIAASSTKVFLYVLLRFDFFIFQGNLPGSLTQLSQALLPLAVVAVLAASAIALVQRNVKRLLAYSSIAQVGYILFGAGLVSVTGLTAGIVHIFNHALAKGTLFLAIACLGVSVGGFSLERIAGAARRMPFTMAALVLGGLSLIGLPGTAGFISKWYLVLGALEMGAIGALLVAPILLSSMMAVFYIWKIVEAAYLTESTDVVERREAPWWMLAVLWTAAFANVWFGLRPGFPLQLARAAAESLLAGP